MTGNDHVRCANGPIDPEAEHRAVRQKIAGEGAMASFTGIARPHSDDAMAAEITLLRLQHYPGFTEQSIADGIEQARARWPLGHCHIVHRIGDMVPGDPIVFVAATARHRRAAFAAADFLMDWLKTEAAFWKCEITRAGKKWIAPRDQDYRDRERWEEGQNG
ncbi:MAG: molybdenum cofactor biosynthesis protein MoaE [Pseudomonadota bacterium]